jgi:hypothetical protein
MWLQYKIQLIITRKPSLVNEFIEKYAIKFARRLGLAQISIDFSGKSG